MPQREKRYPRLGELIKDLVRKLAAEKRWRMTPTMAYICDKTYYGPDMVYHWRQGKACPTPETIEILANIGKEDANLTREWGESLLYAAYHPDAVHIVNRLWGPKTIRSIPCNLPSRDRAQLIGRLVEIDHLLELLSPDIGTALITVDGIGGVGKSALVLEVAELCRQVSTGEESNSKVPRFEAIIFVSAKQQYLTPIGILPSIEAKRTLRDIFREIASTLEYTEITYTAPHEQISIVHKALKRQATLLIVDNLETMEDKQEILSFLYELPRSVKVVVTTRERVLFSPIRLEQLTREAALGLIEEEAQEKEAGISEEQALQLYDHLGGIPAALIYAIGQIASGYSVETVLRRIPKADSDVARFCFEGSIEQLQGKPAHHLLMTLAMFPKPPRREALIKTAGYMADNIAVEEGLAQLRKLSLIKEQESRYTMFPLTREFALSELAAHASFEQEARERWVEWYLNFTDKFGGKDWQDWYIRYDKIEDEWENLLTVFDWCAAHEQYDTIQTFWQGRQLVKFAHIYGHWDDRLLWLDWLIQVAQKRSDWTSAVKAIVDIGSTFTLKGQFEEANRYFQRALQLREHADPVAQVFLAQKISDFHIRQKEYPLALTWLGQAETLLNAITPSLGERERSRRWADFQSHKGLFFYSQKDYKQAEPYYRSVLDQAQFTDWERTAIYAQNHLAYIVTALDRLEEAEALLQKGLTINIDRRLTAFHNYVFAYFCTKKGRLNEARRLAREAFDEFERLGMRQETMEVDELLQQLNR